MQTVEPSLKVKSPFDWTDMVNRTMAVKPDALKPLICEVVRPFVLPMLPLQKIMAVAAEIRDGLAIN